MSQMSWDISLCVPVLRTGMSRPRMGLSRPNPNTAQGYQNVSATPRYGLPFKLFSTQKFNAIILLLFYLKSIEI